MIFEYKPPGILMSTLMNQLKAIYSNNKLAYAGRLDPMARGLVPILFDEECCTKDNVNNMNKIYEVKLIVGYQTDTDDVLGIFNSSNILYSYNTDLLLKNLKEGNISIGPFEQKFHYYSTKAINQRSKGINMDNFHTVTLHNCSVLSSGKYDSHFLIDDIIKTIHKIDKTKDFRQNEIIDQWRNVNVENFEYINLKLDVSSGFFVRQFVRDLSEKYKVKLMCYDIHRINLY